MFGLPRLYLYGAAALAVVGIIGWQRIHIANLQTKLAKASVTVLQCADANATNVATIERQDRALQQWKQLGEVAKITLQKSKDAVEAANNDLENLRRENRRLRNQDQTPECQALLRSDLTAICPGVDLGLRTLSEGCKGQHSGDPCSDPEGAATGTD